MPIGFYFLGMAKVVLHQGEVMGSIPEDFGFNAPLKDLNGETRDLALQPEA